MTLTSKALITLSTLLLTHSCYSAHEHASTFASSASQLPTDILVETLLAAALLCLGLVLSAGSTEDGALRPISLRVWAGKLEREKGCGPFGFLEERLGFFDVRGAREEFAEFVKAKGS
ncbi:magnesium transporter [Geopyxis carbonaria]|nr:magnesium transporter [Geopyxis carbonaria]